MYVPTRYKAVTYFLTHKIALSLVLCKHGLLILLDGALCDLRIKTQWTLGNDTSTTALSHSLFDLGGMTCGITCPMSYILGILKISEELIYPSEDWLTITLYCIAEGILITIKHNHTITIPTKHLITWWLAHSYERDSMVPIMKNKSMSVIKKDKQIFKQGLQTPI